MADLIWLLCIVRSDLTSNLSSKSLKSKKPLSFITFKRIYLLPFLVVLYCAFTT